LILARLREFLVSTAIPRLGKNGVSIRAFGDEKGRFVPFLGSK
jgi:hypothetical protein